MSMWTHVAGCLRIDTIRMLNDDKVYTDAIEKILGNIVTYENENEGINTKLPMGSEGSIEYVIYTNPNRNHIAAFNVLIWGDLRDFGRGDTDVIVDWFTNVTNDLTNMDEKSDIFFSVRDFTLLVRPEDSGKPIHISAEDDKIAVTMIPRDK